MDFLAVDEKITVWLDPALGTQTCATSRILEFNAYIPTAEYTAVVAEHSNSKFELELWWTAASGECAEWQSSAFVAVDGELVLASGEASMSATRLLEMANSTSSLREESDNTVTRLAVRFVPPRNATVLKFTARYRIASPEWTWIGNPCNNGKVMLLRTKLPPKIFDGIVYARAELPDFDELFGNVPRQFLDVSPVTAQVVNSKVWKVAGVAPSGLHIPTLMKFGKPVNMLQYLALVRISSSWMGPRHGNSEFDIDKPGFLLLFQRSDGCHVALLPYSSMKDLVTFYLDSEEGYVVFNVSNTSNVDHKFVAFVGVAKEPRHAVESVLYSLRSYTTFTMSTNYKTLLKDVHAPEDDLENVHPVYPIVRDMRADEPLVGTWFEQWMDCMGFCTWNSMGVGISHDKVMAALASLHERGVRIGMLILDDGWQVVNDQRQLVRFEANEKFPMGLKYTVDAIKAKYPYIKHVSVWHALLGYWNGIAPDGEIGKKYKTVKGTLYNNTIYIVDGEDVNKFYDDFYGFLYSCGITLVKTDVQMHIYDIKSDAIEHSDIFRKYQDALKLQSLRYFNRGVMYSMAMSEQYYYYSLLQTSSPKPSLRNSDDFFPNIPDSHHWHIYCNAMNATLTSLLHVIPDWDMFMTTIPPFSMQHAAARCFSGGPVYITDTAGFHDMDLIAQIQAETIRGYAVSLRPSMAAVPVDPYFDLHDKRVLFLWNFYGGSGGFSMLAAFNVTEGRAHEGEDDEVLVAPVKMGMLPGIVSGSDYVLRSYVTGETVEFTMPAAPTTDADEDAAKPLMLTKLKSSEWDIFTAAPLATIKTHYKTIKVGAIGLLNHMTGAAAIERQQVTVPRTGRATLDVDMKVLGTLGIYVSDFVPKDADDVATATRDAIARLLVTIQGTVMPLTALSAQGNVLKVDLERAWTDLKLTSKWSNEIALRIYFS
ncbi:raffinose synthase or seed imbibition protein Sip1-domain-containing protein [Limtongia smithiae]|uniref:raffinose synthase or seed imbibition protein Sip1-domain-containing protein n=1 Tax=Limtongia smithiae TaxID=1125753 RepID=UPI0034D00F50